MPSVKILNIKSHVAADDLPVPVALFATFHAALVAVCVAVLVGFSKGRDNDAQSVIGYSYSMLAVAVLSFVLEYVIVRTSRRGVSLAMSNACLCAAPGSPYNSKKPKIRPIPSIRLVYMSCSLSTVSLTRVSHCTMITSTASQQHEPKEDPPPKIAAMQAASGTSRSGDGCRR